MQIPKMTSSKLRGLGVGIVLGGLLVGARLQAIEEVKASHILLRSQEDALRVREEIVKAGGDRKAFANACRQHSLDAYTKPLAGDVGWFPRVGKMDPVFSDSAFNLKAGDISEPVKTQFGWHLIRLTDRRDRSLQTSTPTPTPTPTDPDSLIPGDAGPNRAPDTDPNTAVTTAETSAPPAAGKRRRLSAKRLVLRIESVQADYYAYRANSFSPERAAEYNLVLKNEGTEERRVPAPELLVMGFDLKQHVDGKIIAGDFSGIPEPEDFFVTLKTYEMVGREISVNDVFRGLRAVGRFDLSWDAGTLLANLESRFPRVKDLPDYLAIKIDLTSGGRAAIRVDKIRRDGARHWKRKRAPLSLAIFPRIQTGAKVYARVKVRGESTPVFIQLETQAQQLGVTQHFASLALEGFYDNLRFHEVQVDSHVLGGCPQGRGTGAPSMDSLQRRNAANIPHVEGTVSFVSRNLSKGPVQGGEIGSIFFVSFKEHPEWNDIHVPFGKVVSGLDILKKVSRGDTIESIDVLPESSYDATNVASTQFTSGGTGGEPAIVPGNPEAVIKTSKGDLVVTLYEDVARNTVWNFVTLSEEGFYDKAEGGGKQKFFDLMVDDRGKVMIQTGSPTNAAEGGKDYTIPDEINRNTCSRGALVMSKLNDEDDDRLLPDSASTQFFIMLRDEPYYDDVKAFTVFGKVNTPSLAVLDKLSEGDEILEVKVTTKK
ncbi:MAG: peptidylprolyl isomerase, partial [Planctomycetota bacterium]|nr:peptidylprolyl isomerase [Planctomycetota bacterium]